MHMKLKTLVLHNFKGISDFTLTTNGKNASIHAANGVGKTTLYDAFQWLLFGKDSSGRKDFEVKPIGAPRGIEVSVEALFDIDGKEAKLKKVLKENWVKQKGKLEAEFKGNETMCYIDDVPTRITPYNAYIKRICSEDIFKLLTNPMAFNTQMKWQDRRKLLFEICGDKSDEDVIASSAELAELEELKSHHSVEDYKKILTEQKKAINRELESLPIRIEESYAQVIKVDTESAKSKLDSLTDEYKRLLAAMQEIENGTDIAEAQCRLTDVQQQMKSLEMTNEQFIHEQKQSAIREIEKQRSDLMDQLSEIQNECITAKSLMQNAASQVETQSVLRKKLLARYAELDKAEESIQFVCPTCGQDIPKEDIQKSRDAIAKEKQSVLEAGKTAASQLESAKAEQTRQENQFNLYENKKIELKIQIRELVMQDFTPQNITGYEDKRVPLAKKIDELNQQLADLKANAQERLREVKTQCADVESKINHCKAMIQQDEVNKNILARIETYDAQQKEYAVKLEQIEKGVYLCDLFTKQKVKLVTDSINAKFRLARFKLFDQQINGGISDCCEVTFDGVPYNDLNSAMRINIGLDIVATLQQHYDCFPPIWIDNAESVTDIYSLDCQMIRLYVSAVHCELFVDTDD